MGIARPTSNATLAVIVMVAVSTALSGPPAAGAEGTTLPGSAHDLLALLEPSASPMAPPQARPSSKPRPSTKPKPTPKPTPTPIRTTPRPSVVRATPRPTATATAAATPPVTAQATAPSPAPTADTPVAGGSTAEPPLDTAASDNLIIPVALIAAAVIVLVLARVARRRLLPPAEDGASRAPGAADAPFAPVAAAAALPVPRRGVPEPEPTGEEHLPRWRRPSVVAARFETVNSAAIKAAAGVIRRRRPAQRFGTDADIDRWVLRYDGVVLLDRPDDVHGRPMEGLQADDEVALLERDELWANVATPGGRAGWIPAMALGPATPPATPTAGMTDAAGEPASAELTSADEPSPSDDTVIDSLLANPPKAQPERS